jgi:NAD+ kinase
MKVAIFGSRFYSDRLHQIVQLFDSLHQRGAALYVCRDFYDFLSSVMNEPPSLEGFIDCNDFTADIALSIGGDGTFLRTAHRIGNKGIPILGVNTGRLGFLAEVEFTEMGQFMNDLFDRNFHIDRLSQLQLCVNGQLFEEYPSVLNEIAILKGDTSSMINIHVVVDGEYLNGYQADGLLISTPTGSTAYALSVGGPIIMPGNDSMLIAAVAPHNLSIRPIVLKSTSAIELEIESRSRQFIVSLDGSSYHLPCSAKLQIKMAEEAVYAIRRNNYSFAQTLRKKLYWGLDPRQDVR